MSSFSPLELNHDGKNGSDVFQDLGTVHPQIYLHNHERQLLESQQGTIGVNGGGEPSC